MRPLTRVVSGPEAAANDASTIAAGVPSRALMQRAGAAGATEVALRYPDRITRGVLVLAGPGNNGGDGWVMARALAAAGADVCVHAPEGAKSPDCVSERALALPSVREVDGYTGEGLVIDAMLGTGSTGAARGKLASALDLLKLARDRDAVLVAVDLPSGLDATTGAPNGAVSADLTVTFGSVKRGHLIARGICGTIAALDIGLVPSTTGAELVDGGWVRANLPPIEADAHKGTRRKLLLHGGGSGMAGAAILALRAALASGIGMVKARVHPSSVDAVHVAVPASLIDTSPDGSPPDAWADVLVIGPGLGSEGNTKAMVQEALRGHAGPVLLDADAITAFAGDLKALRDVVGSRPALLTPHPAECARLLGVDVKVVLDRRFDIGLEVARETGAVVLLKGVPTIISAPDGRCFVVASGTPTLATGGSGDALAGIAGALLAQMDDPVIAAACAAWVHGYTARLAGAFVRGTTLDDVLETLPNAWRFDGALPRYPLLAELPAVRGQ